MAPVDEIQVGDVVNVPGGMYGTVKFLGPVAGKQGRFAGIELAPEYAGKGKNNGAVDGRQYFTTSRNCGIFIPANPNSKHMSKRETPAPAAAAPRTPARPSLANFSKSVGPGTAPPTLNRPKVRRPSLNRPESPRVSPTKPSFSGLRTPSAFSRAPPLNGNTPRTPIRSLRTPSRPLSRASIDDGARTPTSVRARTPSFDKLEYEETIRKLEQQLRDRDKQLEEQAKTLAEFQESITELEGVDALQVRAQLREKNEKIAALTTEFDSHRADFRSTLDTLEVAAAETERVYEQRIEELMQVNQELQERTADVETVAKQLKDLEELVTDLEDGLEDARRGEAEARGEVEFLRGEVERAQLELKQEKERSAAALKEASEGSGRHPTSKDFDQKDDEIRGLKAIIHSLSRGDPVAMQGNGMAGGSNPEDAERISQLEQRVQELEALMDRKNYRIEELEGQLDRMQQPSTRTRATSSSTITTTSPLNVRKNAKLEQTNSGTSHSYTLSDRTVVPPDWNDVQGGSSHFSPPSAPRRQLERKLPTMQESDNQSISTDDGGALWCEICETSGHDILTCTNMFGSGAGNGAKKGEATHAHPASSRGPEDELPANIGSPSNVKNLGSPSSQRSGRDAVLEGLRGIGNRPSMGTTPVAGKESKVIDESKWCALCERDGHESIDCPFESADY